MESIQEIRARLNNEYQILWLDVALIERSREQKCAAEWAEEVPVAVDRCLSTLAELESLVEIPAPASPLTFSAS